MKNAIITALQKFQRIGDINTLHYELRNLFVTNEFTSTPCAVTVKEVEVVAGGFYMVGCIDDLKKELTAIKAAGNDPRKSYQVSLTSSGSILNGLTA